MILFQTVVPTVEPISLTEAKLHCRSDAVEDNSLIQNLIEAARQNAETVTGRALCTQTWVLKQPHFPRWHESTRQFPERWFWAGYALPPAPAIEIPKPPLVSITSIKYLDSTGAQQTWADTNYTVLAPTGPYAERGLVFPKAGVSYPVTYPSPEAVEVTFVAGYGAAAAVPAGIKAAMLLRIGELYKQREVSASGTVYTVTQNEQSLLWPFRSLRAA